MESKVKRKVLLLSSGDTFGAYEYIYRMAKFMEDDYEVAMVVRDKRKIEPWLFQIDVALPKKKFIKKISNFFKRKIGIRDESFTTDPQYVFLPNEDESVQFVTAELILQQISFVPDIIISGMTDGFLNTTTLYNLNNKTGAQVYQMMVDMNFITGGCHFIRDCEGFKSDCRNCPAIMNVKYKHFTASSFAIKKRNIEQGNFKIMVVNGWTNHQANLSILYRNRLKFIASSVIDIDVFTDINRNIAKQVFGIPQGVKVIFAGAKIANSEIKGRKYFIEALSEVWEQLDEEIQNNTIILMVGNDNEEDEQTKEIRFKKIFIDYITDYRLLSLAYQASDIFVCPSLEDGGPMMVAEALACGTPVVGFETGLLFDDTLVQNGMNGYRVRMKDTQELALALQKIITLSDVEFQKMSDHARLQALKHVSKEAYLRSIEDI